MRPPFFIWLQVVGFALATTVVFSFQSCGPVGIPVEGLTSSSLLPVPSASPPPTVDNQAPTVSMTSPPDNSSYTASQNLRITAAASDNVGVAKVEFYKDNALVGTDLSVPYENIYTISSRENGSHSYFARAYDATGNVATSPTVNFSVNVASTGGGTFNVSHAIITAHAHPIGQTWVRQNIEPSKRTSWSYTSGQVTVVNHPILGKSFEMTQSGGPNDGWGAQYWLLGGGSNKGGEGTIKNLEGRVYFSQIRMYLPGSFLFTTDSHLKWHRIRMSREGQNNHNGLDLLIFSGGQNGGTFSDTSFRFGDEAASQNPQSPYQTYAIGLGPKPVLAPDVEFVLTDIVTFSSINGIARRSVYIDGKLIVEHRGTSNCNIDFANSIQNTVTKDCLINIVGPSDAVVSWMLGDYWNNKAGIGHSQSFYVRDVIIGSDYGDVPIETNGTIEVLDPNNCQLMP